MTGDSRMKEDAGWKCHYFQIVQTGKRCSFRDCRVQGLVTAPPLARAPCMAPSAAVLRGPGLSYIRTSLKMAGWKMGKVKNGTG